MWHRTCYRPILGKADEAQMTQDCSTAKARVARACRFGKIRAWASSPPSAWRHAFTLSWRAHRPSMADVSPQLPHPAHLSTCAWLPLSLDSEVNVVGTRRQHRGATEPLSTARGDLQPAHTRCGDGADTCCEFLMDARYW